MSEALYRKYRPQIFEDVVGQEHIERTIKNAIEQDKVSHAYLFCGPRGTGKTTTARLLAKALLCQRGPTAEPDGTCDDCKMIAEGTHPDVYELDAASRTGVDNVREEIIGRVQFAPTRGRYKIYIIDEVHMLSTAAFNALLKTLEEPPSHVVFILATTDPQKVPETIHSRCQRFDFRRISPEAMVARLGAVCVAEGVEFEGEALDLIAHRAEGGLRNALTSLEQMIAFGEGKVTMDVAERMLGSLDSSDLAAIVQAVGARDVAACFRWTAEYVETGADLAQFVRDFAEHMRNMYVLALAGDDVALDVSDSVRRELAEELPLFGGDRLARMLCVLGDVSADLKMSTNPRLTFEIALTRMCRPDSDLTLESLAERIEALEAGHSAVAHVVSVGAAGTGRPAAGAAGARPAGAASGTGSAQPAEGRLVGDQPAGAGEGRIASGVGSPVASVAHSGVGGAFSGTSAHSVVEDERTVAPVSLGGGQPAGFEQAGAVHSGGEVSAGGRVDVSHETSGAAAPAGGALSAGLLASLQNPAALQRVWQAALSTLKKNKAAYGVLFMNTKAVFDTARSLLVAEFPAENTFAFKAVQKQDVQDALAAALRQACGEPIAFAYSQAGGGSFVAGGSGVAATACSGRVQQQGGQSQGQMPERAASQLRGGLSQHPRGQEGGRPRQMQNQDGASSHRMHRQENAQSQPQFLSQHDTGTRGQVQGQSRVADAHSSFVPPEPDFAPVDIYDDVVPYDDEPAPYDFGAADSSFGARAQSADAAVPAQPVQMAAAPRHVETPPWKEESGQSDPSMARRSGEVAQPPVSRSSEAGEATQSSTPSQSSSSQGADLGEEGLEALLSASFGGGVVVKEVQ